MSATPEPFADDCQFLEQMFDLLQVRVRRLVAERDLRVRETTEPGERPRIGRPLRADDDDDLGQRIAVLTAREERCEGSLQARLAAHRANPQARRIGLDRLTQAHDLTNDMRLILVSAALFALSEERSEQVFGDLACGMFGAQCIEGLLRLLDAQSVADRVGLRRLFDPKSPLLAGGLIVLDRLRNDLAMPENLLGCRVRITDSAFSVLVGIGPVLSLVGVQE